MTGKPTVKRIRDASQRSREHIISKAGKNISCGICKEKGHNKTTCTQVPRPTKTNVTKKQRIMQTQESVVTVNKSKQVVTVNEAEELGRVNQIVRQVNTTGQPSKRKKLERILKLKLAKRVEGEGSTVGSPMELD
ncbi:unnamed protein product [Lactuca saligna]|uniref:Uncharacterized protein n=1 Tax=Lactuca saligna TaxID=75948 RepID=A0AA35Y8V5_LACSI|nr:unnamed protein product [Lactuca saligna]